jgi:hypothetical protein
MQQRRSCRLVLVALACMMMLHMPSAANGVDALSPLSAPHPPSPALPPAAAISNAAAASLPHSKEQQQQHDSAIRVWIPPFFALCASVPPHPHPTPPASSRCD